MNNLELINVVDIEATCYRNNRFPKGEKPEIIQIGISQLNLRNLNIIKKDCIYIIPEQSRISNYCIKITGITDEIISDKGIYFKNAIDILVDKYKSKKVSWSSWGGIDKILFKKQCEYYSIEYPFNSYVDIQLFFSNIYGFFKTISLKEACNFMNIEGDFHNAENDSYCTALIYAKTLEKIRNKFREDRLKKLKENIHP